MLGVRVYIWLGMKRSDIRVCIAQTRPRMNLINEVVLAELCRHTYAPMKDA